MEGDENNADEDKEDRKDHLLFHRGADGLIFVGVVGSEDFLPDRLIGIGERFGILDGDGDILFGIEIGIHVFHVIVDVVIEDGLIRAFLINRHRGEVETDGGLAFLLVSDFGDDSLLIMIKASIHASDGLLVLFFSFFAGFHGLVLHFFFLIETGIQNEDGIEGGEDVNDWHDVKALEGMLGRIDEREYQGNDRETKINKEGNHGLFGTRIATAA